MDAKAKKRARERQEKQKKNEARKREAVETSILKHDASELKTECSSVEKCEDLSFVNNLKRILSFTKNGVGLSANQIGITKKAFVIRPRVATNEMKVFLNTEILEKGETIAVMTEGCLSYPEFFTEIERPTKIKVKYLDENFNEKIEVFHNFVARIILHEFDHSEGVCLVGQKWQKEQ